MTNPGNQKTLQLLFQPTPVAALNAPDSSVNKSALRASTAYTWNEKIHFIKKRLKQHPQTD